jgi:Na+/H+ antiporter NhaC
MDQPDILSLLPIATTLVVALLSRDVLAGLGVGLFVGVLMVSVADPLSAG